MPVALDSNETHRYVISTDRAKPVQPTLIFHFPTGREQRQIARLFDAEAKDVDQLIEQRCDAVRVILVGWENFTDRDGNAIAYNPEMLDVVLSDNDLAELEARLLREMSLAELDKKKFALSARLSSEGSAPNAPAAAGLPPTPSLLKSNVCAAGDGRQRVNTAANPAEGGAARD